MSTSTKDEAVKKLMASMIQSPSKPTSSSSGHLASQAITITPTKASTSIVSPDSSSATQLASQDLISPEKRSDTSTPSSTSKSQRRVPIVSRIGDVTTDFDERDQPSVIVHFADTSGFWPRSQPLFSALAERFPATRQNYEQSRCELGDLVVSKSTGAVFVATLIVVQALSGGRQRFELAAFEKAFKLLFKAPELAHIRSIHFAFDENLPGLDLFLLQRHISGLTFCLRKDVKLFRYV